MNEMIRAWGQQLNAPAQFDCPPGCPPFPPGPPPWFAPPTAPWYPGANGGVSFSATAPLNPCRGNFWWDGVTLWMFDGAAWVVVGGTGAPVQGITNGVAAAPGTVGEYIETVVQVSFPTASQTITVNAATLQPGDWDAQSVFFPNVWLTGGYFLLTPQPAGVSNNMSGIVGTAGTMSTANVSLSAIEGITAQVLNSVPVTLSFAVTTNFEAAGQAGVGDFVTYARRRR